jgi:16S rRNA (cytosine967-C5)-methyltransferase
MTPGARAAAAIEVLDAILAGQPAEPALTTWARAHRFVGSGDRAALRDLVFDALRCRRSAGALGGGDTGRGLILGLLRQRGEAALFSGEGHAPPPPAASEAGRPPAGAEALDCPDWLAPALQDALGPDYAPVLTALQSRAPVFLRANLGKLARDAALAALAAEGITALPVPGVASALHVTGNARKIQTSTAYLQGLVELQDLSSQDLCASLPLRPGSKVLDFCAGGGGKSLAMAALAPLRLFAHDAAPQRLRDLPPRAARAGVAITLTDQPARTAPYDLILTDVPCSGSGSWRRDPQGKWALTPARLQSLCQTQAAILDQVAPWVAPSGRLAYATCSLLSAENEDQVAAFLHRHPGWICDSQRRWSPLSDGDGFYLALLTPPSAPPTQP